MINRLIGCSLICFVPAFLVGAIVGSIIGGQPSMFEPDITDEEAAELTALEYMEHTFKPAPPATTAFKLTFAATFSLVFCGGVYYLMRETRPYTQRVGPTGDIVRVVRQRQLRA